MRHLESLPATSATRTREWKSVRAVLQQTVLAECLIFLVYGWAPCHGQSRSLLVRRPTFRISPRITAFVVDLHQGLKNPVLRVRYQTRQLRLD